jgi:hypothetical protein
MTHVADLHFSPVCDIKQLVTCMRRKFIKNVLMWKCHSDRILTCTPEPIARNVEEHAEYGEASFVTPADDEGIMTCFVGQQ